jgi:hypothetical protein
MSIFEDFYEKEKFIANRKTRKNHPRAYRLWRNRIVKFLNHCDRQQIYALKQIRQVHYDSFIANISKTRSARTISDWKYAIAEFAERGHLNIAVNTSPKQNAARREKKAFKKLLNHFDPDTSRKIIGILGDLIK